MRQTVLSLFLAGAFAGAGSVAAAEDLPRAQSPWDPGFAGAYEEPAFESIHGTRGHFEEGTGPTSWYAPPDYGVFFRAGVQWLSRSSGLDEQTLIVDLPPLSTTALTTDEIGLDDQFKPGAIFTLGFNFDQVSGVDFVYWGLQDYGTDQTVTSNNFLGLAGTLQNSTIDFIFADRMIVDYSASINNAEANYRQTIEGITLLAGFRYFGLSESFNINSRSAITQTASDYHIDTRNQLVGGQFGAGYGLEWGPVRLSIDTKFGVLANISSQSTKLGDFGNAFTRRDYRAESTPVSLISDSTVSARWQMTHWLAFETGYRFMFVENLALAPNQLDLSDSPAGTQIIDPRSSIYLNGLMVNTEFRW